MFIFLYAVLFGAGLYILIQFIRLLFADSDLSLQWAVKFGRKPETLMGKVVWITGASSGIGEYLAYELAKAGCLLVLSARRSDELERVKAKCVSCGAISVDDVLVLPLDVVDFDAHGPAVTTVLDKFHKIDILVNNAGRSQRAQFDDICMEVERDMYELNTLGQISLTCAVLPHMRQRNQGHIVVMSSVAGKFGLNNSSSYCASKFALHGAFESLRCEGRNNNINVTMICPGPVFSDILASAFTGKHKQVLNGAMNPAENRMSTERCAFLCVVATANQLDEVWISRRPQLLIVYLIQYAPALTKRFMVHFTDMAVRMREGK